MSSPPSRGRRRDRVRADREPAPRHAGAGGRADRARARGGADRRGVQGEDPETVRAAALAAGVGAIQLHGTHPHADFIALKDMELTLLRAVSADADLRCGAFDEDLLLVDAPRAGSGEPWDWAAVRGRPTGRWMLAGGLTPGNVGEAIEAARPWGSTCPAGWRSPAA